MHDYQSLKCNSGKMIGEPIFKLNEVKMGCFPKQWTTLQKIGVSIGGGMAILIITCLVFWMLRNSREAKFFMFYYLQLDTVPKDDTDENVDNMEYDAFFCYR